MTEVRAILLQELKVSLSATVRVQSVFSTYPDASLMYEYMTYCNTFIGKSKIISIVNQNSYDQCLPYDNRCYLQISTYLHLTITHYYTIIFIVNFSISLFMEQDTEATVKKSVV